MKWIATAAALMAVAPCALAQSADLTALLSGTSTPLSYKLKELNGEWKHVKISSSQPGAGGLGDIVGQIMRAAAMGEMGKGGKKPGSDDLMGMMVMSSLFGGMGGGDSDVYYTKGQTVTIAGESFLVAYKPQKKQLDFMSLAMTAATSGKDADPAAMMGQMKRTEDDAVTLTLVNVKTIGALGDIRPFELKTELEAGNNDPLMQMMMLGSSAKSADTAEEAPAPAPKPRAAAPKKKTPAKK